MDFQPINELFSYGISDKTLHLHLPVNLQRLIKEKGLTMTLKVVNLYMMDAIDKIIFNQNNGCKELSDIQYIYMMSPALIKPELSILNKNLGFKTTLYSKKDLNNINLEKKNEEVKLAKHIFGTNYNIGTACVSMKELNSKDWQNKRDKYINYIALDGVTKENKEFISLITKQDINEGVEK